MWYLVSTITQYAFIDVLHFVTHRIIVKQCMINFKDPMMKKFDITEL